MSGHGRLGDPSLRSGSIEIEAEERKPCLN